MLVSHSIRRTILSFRTFHCDIRFYIQFCVFNAISYIDSVCIIVHMGFWFWICIWDGRTTVPVLNSHCVFDFVSFEFI